jgi:MoaA/NifB/PqqE/SkfB family radical SAM enzyme
MSVNQKWPFQQRDVSWSSSVTDLSVSSEFSADDSSFDDLLQLLAQLQDGFDHPDLWIALEQAGHKKDADVLIAIIVRERIGKVGHAAKILDIAAAVLTAVSVDHARGMQMVKQLEAVYSLCPQVAGACFFVSRLNDPNRSADLSTKFCDAPFVKFETLIDGTVAPCCSIWTKKRLGHLETQSFDEIWNSAEAVEMRESILDGSFRFCNKQRCTRILEDELPDREAVSDVEMRAIIDEGKTWMEEGPKWLFLAHDITCNLACPSCRHKLLGADEAQEARFAKIEEQVFFPLLNADGKVTISVSGQGDPWSSQHYRSILRYMADHDLNAELEIHTNALLMGEQRWNGYLGLEKYRPMVNVSIDACTPWVYEIVRRPGKWEKLEPNLRFIAGKRAAGIFSEFHINATVQLDNFHEMPALVDYAEDLGADTVRLYMIQNTGGHLAADYDRKNVGDELHPLHLAFLETLRDPKFGRPSVHLYDVSTWRNIALNAQLPSDDLPEGWSQDDLYDLIEGTLEAGDLPKVAALCAAGRIRFPLDLDLFRLEARVLEHLDFEQQAQYRDKQATELERALNEASEH